MHQRMSLCSHSQKHCSQSLNAQSACCGCVCSVGDAVEGVDGRSVGLYQRCQQGPGSRLHHHRHTANRAVTLTHSHSHTQQWPRSSKMNWALQTWRTFWANKTSSTQIELLFLFVSKWDSLFDLYICPGKISQTWLIITLTYFLSDALHRLLFPPSLEFSHVHKCWSEYNLSHDALLLKHSTSTSGEQTTTITRDDQHRGKQQPPFISMIILFAG